MEANKLDEEFIEIIEIQDNPIIGPMKVGVRRKSANGMIASKCIKELMEICHEKTKKFGGIAVAEIKEFSRLIPLLECEEIVAKNIILYLDVANQCIPNLPEIISRMITEAERVK